MGRFLYNLIIFALSTLAGYALLIILLGLFLPAGLRKNLVYTFGGNGFANIRLDQADTTGAKDLLFIGSSRAYRSFDTRIFEEAGYTSFNLGSSNQTPLQSLALLRRYFRHMRPKMVIMEVNPDICSNDGVESAIDLVSNANHYRDQWAYAMSSPDIRVVNTLIFSFAAKASGIRGRFAFPPAGQRYIPGGFVEKAQGHYDPAAGNDYYCKLKDTQIRAIQKICRLVQQGGSELWLVQSPVVPELYAGCSQNMQFDSLVTQISAYENFNLSGTFIAPDHFADGQHLNASGVAVLNRLMLTKIKSRVR